MSKIGIEIANIIENISKNVDNKNWICVHKKCTDFSINSHLLQKNGIINLIAKEGHLRQFSQNNVYNFMEKGRFSFKLVGLKSAIALPIFCKQHDTFLFKEIEQEIVNFEDYNTQLLFSYRATCGEIRNKEIIIEKDGRVISSSTIKTYLGKNHEAIQLVKINVESSKVGVKDLSFYKCEFERNLENKELKLFEFKVFKYTFLEVCSSTVFTPIDTKASDIQTKILQEKPWESIFMNIIPQKDALYLIFGYHKEFTNEWIKKYINSFETNNTFEQKMNISNLIATRTNLWGLSNSLYNSISEKKKNIFIKYWEENDNNLDYNQSFDVNLFE